MMTYMVDARLERGALSLTLTDAVTGEERLHWRGDNTTSGGRNLQGLFKQLVLLSCTDRLSLLQSAKSATFGEECIDCNACVDHPEMMEAQGSFYLKETDNSGINDSVVSTSVVTSLFRVAKKS